MRIFITHILPIESDSIAGISIAASNFSRNLISSGTFDKVFSILPPFVREEIRVLGENKIMAIYFRRLRNTPFSKFSAGKTGADWDSAPEQTGTLLMRQS